MRQLLYVSSTALEPPAKMLEDILAVSRRNNSRAGITGVLLYMAGGFMQVLEGDAPAVTETFDRICMDRRHWKASVLHDRAAPRAFSEWSMGFARVAAQDELASVFALTEDALRGQIKPGAPVEIMTLLQTFYRINS